MSAEVHKTGDGSPNGDHVSIRLVEKLAEARNLDPRDLPPLGRTIDLEALDTFIESAQSELTIEFSIQGHAVTVTGDGVITLDPLSRS